jgi:hypothetical protein
MSGRTFGIILGAILVGAGAVELGPLVAGCGIKGNISTRTGERIYHMPGQTYYFETRINWLRGERWFCSESDARAAGWRKSRVWWDSSAAQSGALWAATHCERK